MDATPQPTWPPSRPASAGRPPAAATLVAVALVGALVGFGGSQAIDHSPTLSRGLAGISALVNGGLPAAPAVSTSASGGGTANPAPANPAAANPASGNPAAANPAAANPAGANPAPVRNRAPGGNRAPAGNPATGNPAAAANPAPADQSAAAGQPASSQDQAAIQQVIQSVDDAQATAVSSNDLSGLSAGATSDFANQQQSVTQDLLANGVTDIQLSNVEWGAITVNGTTATATNYETWSTTYSDGTTDQSRDRNVYTLVQQNGNWVVQADDHPDATGAGLQGIPGIPSNLLPPGFTNPFQNQAPHGQPGAGSTTSPVQVQP